MIADEIVDPYNVHEEVDKRLLVETMKRVLDAITERERKVIEMRVYNGCTLEEVGRKFHVTRERIRQIEAKAIRKLRHPTRSKQLIEFIPNLKEKLEEEERQREKKEEKRRQKNREYYRKRAEEQRALSLLNRGRRAYRKWLCHEYDLYEYEQVAKKEAAPVVVALEEKKKKEQDRKNQRLLKEKEERDKRYNFRYWYNEQCKAIERLFILGSTRHLFKGKCDCREWQAFYPIQLVDEIEIGCLKCLTKFKMKKVG